MGLQMNVEPYRWEDYARPRGGWVVELSTGLVFLIVLALCSTMERKPCNVLTPGCELTVTDQLTNPPSARVGFTSLPTDASGTTVCPS